MTRLLIVSSNVHKELASVQREKCVDIVKKSSHDYHVEIVEAGTYELPFVINHYHCNNPFDGYIALGLVLKTNRDHYDYIMSHIKESFTYFALHHIVVGNGIISGDDFDNLASNVASPNPCLSAYPSAFQAVDYLISLQKNRGKDAFNPHLS